MAPTAARARSQKVAKQATRKPRPQPKQWQLEHRDDSDIENEDPNEQPLMIEQQTAQTLDQLRRLTAGVEAEIEQFAVNLDKFLETLEASQEEPYDDVHDLVLSFKGIASDEAQKNEHEQALHEGEAQTWELFRIILEQHYNGDRSERQAELDKLGPIHRYSPESVLFQQFTITDDLARERALIKGWLENNAPTDEPPKGDIAWYRGWMKTRETIKNEKRLRDWPAPDSAPLPQLRSENNELLVSCLDPDAPSRQQRTIQPKDQQLETALWKQLWTFLRRGESVEEIRRWAGEQNECWRSALGSSEATSLAIFRHACFVASQSSSGYEAAVYGLLGGNITAVQKVCHTIDDKLYAHYATALVQQFDHYLSLNYPERVPQALLTTLDNPSREKQAREANEAITSLIKQLRTQSNESSDPIKIIQSYLLANQAESLVHTVGTAINGADLVEAAVPKHISTLRITTHIAILLQVLREEPLQYEEQQVEDNVVEIYIQELTKIGKRDITPLYGSRMSPERAEIAMARVLEHITESREREDILALMGRIQIDVAAVLNRMLEAVIEDIEQSSSKPVSILQRTDEEPELYPGQRINLDAEPDIASALEQRLVRTLEWFLMVTNWRLTFDALGLALRKLLIHGCFAGARLIVESFKSDSICQDKTYRILGRSVNLFSAEISRPSGAEGAQWDTMQRQAMPYRSLEHLVDVYELLFAWRKQEQLYAHATPRSPSVPKELKQTFAELEEAMDPLLSPTGFLLDVSRDEAQEQDFAIIRQAYITDAIIAYNTVLYAAGRLISRDKLLQSMDLATVVAKDSTHLTETFAKAGRLQELVTSFAYSSKAILIMKATGKPWRPRYEKRQGRDVSIWDVPPQKTLHGDEILSLS